MFHSLEISLSISGPLLLSCLLSPSTSEIQHGFCPPLKTPNPLQVWMSLLTLDQLLSSSYGDEGMQEIDFYKEGGRALLIEVEGNDGLLSQQQQTIVLPESSGEDHEMRAPKKRAETWIQEETRSLIGLRREMDGLFNTSKSNKHLWEKISAKMRDKGFERSPNMCTDKWRNLLKEFKKEKHQHKGRGSAKMSYYKELDELLKERNRNGTSKGSPTAKLGSYMQFSEKGKTMKNLEGSIFSKPLSRVTIKIFVCEDTERMTVRAEDKTLYSGDDFRDFLSRRGWTVLREFSGFRNIDSLEDIRSGVMYQGVRLLGGGL